MKKWNTIKLGDVCLKIGSGATPRGGKEAYKESGTFLIRSQNVLDFSFSQDGIVYIDEEQAQKLDTVTVHSGDVLINITGDSVARACIVPDMFLPARTNQHVAIIRADSNVIDNRFLLYGLQLKKGHLLSIASSGGTRNALTKAMLENFDLELPSWSEQRAIAGLLSSLDNKIDLNQKINHNLPLAA